MGFAQKFLKIRMVGLSVREIEQLMHPFPVIRFKSIRLDNTRIDITDIRFIRGHQHIAFLLLSPEGESWIRQKSRP